MAHRVIETPPMIPFLKIREILPVPGSKFKGLYQSKQPSSNEYEGKLIVGTTYNFILDKDGNQGALTVSGPLEKQMAQANPTLNEVVTLNFVGYAQTKKGEMRVITVEVDDPPLNPPKAKSPAPVTAASTNNDIPF